MSEDVQRSLLEHLSVLEDPRQSWKVVYPLEEILLVVLCATLAGADDFVEAAERAGAHLCFLRRFRPFARGIPSHDTLNDVINALDPGLFEECFLAWVAGLRQDGEALIAVDGKTARRTGNRRRGQYPLHVVSAWASAQRLVLAQEITTGKAKEDEAIPALLDKLTLRGALVSIDAAGTHRPVAAQIVEAGGDYLLAFKANQPRLLAAVRAAFTAAATVAPLETHERSHGRVEIRRHWVSTAVVALGERHSWPGLAAIAMVECTATRAGKTSTATRYYLSSRPLTPADFAAVVRGHWSIENGLHWVLDVVFRDDHCRLRSGFGPRNMALVKHIAMNLLKATPENKASLKVRRKKAAWSTDYLASLLTGPAAQA
ncbi:ISAs1 family transposase [Azospirillum rugosum]|uniref:Transposase YbfD/YdcC n=1 Tax=Azospirillum rugosum TaxID=416170 RepID=A0ABS4SV23_9PROT|nr:ISAs1 family transposase [Azospirillum rugosum]MBP2296428.1 putative transposase YbfD/YdcC [Azospirillum rugosum]MDQ0529949.1 putative transposase YbfD/YdcC [Azospirillum rugosum]